MIIKQPRGRARSNARTPNVSHSSYMLAFRRVEVENLELAVSLEGASHVDELGLAVAILDFFLGSIESCVGIKDLSKFRVLCYFTGVGDASHDRTAS